jgi:hypothetical protein
MQLNHTHDATTKSWLESANVIGFDACRGEVLSVLSSRAATPFWL